MNLYLDANAILSLLLADERSEQVTALVEQSATPPTISDFGEGEVVAVVSRHLRTGSLRAKTAARVLAELDAMQTSVSAIVTQPEVIAQAAALVRRFELKLRMPDAIHLAFCIATGLTLVTGDRLLIAATHAVGFAVEPV